MNKLRIVDNVDLKEVLGARFVEKDKAFECIDEVFDEFVYVDKTTRIIFNSGFTGFLQGLADDGLLEVVQ